MSKYRLLHYLKLGVAAFFLLNFSTICVICFFAAFGPIASGAGFFQGFVWGMMLNDISGSAIIIAIRIFLFLSSVYFWFRRQNWLTAAYLIIAGTGAGLLGVYFFAFYHLSILGCVAVLLFCFCASLCLKLLARLKKFSKIQALAKIWRNFWTPAKIAVACAICALILTERFIPWEFPIFSRTLPYVVNGHSWAGRIPPYENGISIAVDVSKHAAKAADIAATCAAAARYFTEKHGLQALKVSVYDYIGEIQKYDQCFYLLGECRYAPNGFYLYERDRNLKPGWGRFRVARDIPEKEILECNRIKEEVDKKDLDIVESDKMIRNEMGYWAYSKLEPDLMEVIYNLLPKNLCEKPAVDKNSSFPISRTKLIEECEELYNGLKVLGARPDFPICYKEGCEDKAYRMWVRRKYMLWDSRKGNFAPEIISYNTSLDALAKAYSQRDNEKINSLVAKLDNILAELKQFVPCGSE